jgi:hypothetical protein
VLRKLGIRTAQEIEQEREALLTLGAEPYAEPEPVHSDETRNSSGGATHRRTDLMEDVNRPDQASRDGESVSSSSDVAGGVERAAQPRGEQSTVESRI